MLLYLIFKLIVVLTLYMHRQFRNQLGKRNYLKQCVGKCHDVTEDKHQEQSMLK